MKDRRDNRKRVLRSGESQRKDGRYRYKYVDANGIEQNIYSWKLVSTDSVPKGNRDCEALRDMEKKVTRDLEDKIVSCGGELTVLDLAKKYISMKTGVRHNTQANYNFVVNLIAKEVFGSKRIDKVKPSDAKNFLIQLQKDGKGYSTIHAVRGVLRPAFKMALDDDYIRKNPFDFELKTVVENDSVKREAITVKEEKAFLDFIKADEHYSRYYDGMYILFHTGLRISEFVGLTFSDIDFEAKQISVNHQLQRMRNMTYIIEDTKTTSGTRIVPMSNEVCECFKRIISHRRNPKIEPMIDGYTGFLFLDKKNMPEVALHWEKHFEWALGKYNKTHKLQMRKITPHVCRHTFCSNMANAGMNPKTLQKIMGHADIAVTLNVYTHIQDDAVAEEFNRVVNQ